MIDKSSSVGVRTLRT